MLGPFWTRSLFSRVFFHGLIVLLASAATFVVLGSLLVQPVVDRQLLGLGSWIARGACQHLTTTAGQRERAPDVVASVYSTNGRLLGSVVTPPVPPLSAAQVARLRLERALALPGTPPIHAFWCQDIQGGAYVELRPPLPPLTSAFGAPFLLVVAIVALASVPFARSIARPLAELVRVTQALGRGELAVRTSIARRDEVGELARAFNQMADRLQRLILAEQELLANVSHELRTPLARIRVVLETAQENPRRAEALLQEIGKDLGDLEQLVETVMETMRLEMRDAPHSGGLSPVRLEPTDMIGAVQDAVERFRGLYPEREVGLELEADALQADADPRLLRHLLDNLLDNARKYSDQGTSIVLRVTASEASPELVRVEVVDQGMGIDREDLPHVFEPFFRGDRSRSRTTGGAGLGLALAKKIADAHGGQIAVSSQRGIGTNVCITLPRSRS